MHQSTPQSILQRLRRGWLAHLNSKLVITGVVLGFIACIVLGRAASRAPMLIAEPRMPHYLSPMALFFPTASEMKSRALANLRDDQVLVIVAGNSNFNGVGQNLEDLWTTVLQEKLGAHFKVVNMAIPGSNGIDLGGVLFRMIEPEHPNSVLVFNQYSNNLPSLDSSGDDPGASFTYFLWDAYYKGLFPTDSKFRDQLRKLKNAEMNNSVLAEMHLGEQIDRFLYARDLWNYVGYNYVFTIWTAVLSGDSFYSAFLPRKSFHEASSAKTDLATRLKRTVMTTEELLRNTRAHVDGLTSYGPSQELVENPAHWNHFRELYGEMFEPRVRSKIVVSVLWPSSYFVRQLAPEEQTKFEFVVPHVVDQLETLGYKAIAIGRNFDPEDFEYSFHYTATGARKIADELIGPIVAAAK